MCSFLFNLNNGKITIIVFRWSSTQIDNFWGMWLFFFFFSHRPGVSFSKVPKLSGQFRVPQFLYIFATPRFGVINGFSYIKNMLKDQLFKTSRLQFDKRLFGPEKFPGPSRNRPLVPCCEAFFMSVYHAFTSSGDGFNCEAKMPIFMNWHSQAILLTLLFFQTLSWMLPAKEIK